MSLSKKIEIGVLLTIITTVLGFAYFLGGVVNDISHLKEENKKINEIEKNIEKIQEKELPKSIEGRLSNLESEIDSIKSRIKIRENIPEENCNSVLPSFTYPSSNREVNSSVSLKGQVKNIPIYNHLWVLAFHQNTKSYSDMKKIVPNINKEWEKTIMLTGGRGGDTYDINLVLATDEENSALIACRNSTDHCSIPDSLKVCRQISLTLKK